MKSSTPSFYIMWTWNLLMFDSKVWAGIKSFIWAELELANCSRHYNLSSIFISFSKFYWKQAFEEEISNGKLLRGIFFLVPTVKRCHPRSMKRKGWHNDSDGEFWCGGWCTRCKLKKNSVNFSIESSISPTAPSNFVVDSKTLSFHTSLTVPYTNCYCQSLRVIVEESFLLSCDSAKDLFTVSLFCIIIFSLRLQILVPFHQIYQSPFFSLLTN